MSEVNKYDGLDTVLYPENTTCSAYQFTPPQNPERIFQWYLPMGRAWDAKWLVNSNIYKLIKAISDATIARTLGRIARFMVNTNLFCATVDDGLLREWEISYGIPNSCLGIDNKTEDERRRQIYFIQLNKRWYTEQDLIFIASLFGQEIEIECGCTSNDYIEGFDYDFSYEFATEQNYNKNGCLIANGMDSSNERFNWVIHFPAITSDCGFDYDFDSDFCAGSDQTELECILRALKPADTVLTFSYGTTPSTTCI